MKTVKKIDLEIINCPICDSPNYQEAYRKIYNFWDADGKMLIWSARQVICRVCGMIFTNPQPTSAALENFYKNYSMFREVPLNVKPQLEFLRSSGREEDYQTIFEVGAFDGAFLNVAKEAGYKVFGIEPSDEGVNAAISKYGIKLIQGFFDEKFVRSFDGNFDVVVIRHVLEHVKEPVRFLRLAQEITKPNKYIFIQVPDASRPFRNNVADFFTMEHLFHFTENSLINIANRLVLEVKAVEHFLEKDKWVIRILLKNNSVKKNKKPKLKNEYDINRKIVKDHEFKRAEFIKKLGSKIINSIRALSTTQEIVIYGAGLHTSQLLQLGLIRGIKINCIIDSNPIKWGRVFEGHIIDKPDVLKCKNLPVLISSNDSQEEISKYLKTNFSHLPQIKLYNDLKIC
jgi:2-polyprenyl-3-methyl-5-hydroxy-6-metoxy-1,4-benzoquinol methylase